MLIYTVVKFGGLRLSRPYYEVFCETTGDAWGGIAADLPWCIQEVVRAVESLRGSPEFEGVPGPRIMEDPDIHADDPNSTRMRIGIVSEAQ